MTRKRSITFIPRVLSPRPITFDNSTVIIGSRPDADLVLDEPAEPVHALVRMRGDQTELAAFGPVELNGVLVERASLNEGDHLRIGRLSFVFVTAEEEQKAPPPVELPDSVDHDPAGIPTALIASGEATPKVAGELKTEVALYWGNELLRVSYHATDATVRIGGAENNDVVLAAREIKEKSFTLIAPSDAGPRVHVPGGAPLELASVSRKQDRAALEENTRLTNETLNVLPGEKLAIALGALMLVVKRVPSVQANMRPLGERADAAFAVALASAGIVAAF